MTEPVPIQRYSFRAIRCIIEYLLEQYIYAAIYVFREIDLESVRSLGFVFCGVIIQ